MSNDKNKMSTLLGTFISGIIVVVILFIGLAILSTISSFVIGIFSDDITSATVNKRIDVISDIRDTNITINENQYVKLPTTIAARTHGNTNKSVDVTWDGNIDNLGVGTRVLNGTVVGYDKTVKYTINVLPNPTVTQFGNIESKNSMVSYNVKFTKPAKWVWIKIAKNGNEYDLVTPVIDNSLKYNLYLHYGPGVYHIDILTSDIASNDGHKITYYKQTSFEVNNTDTRNMSYLLPTEYIESDNQEIIDLAYQITHDKFSDMDKTQAIYDWVASNIQFDTNYISNNTITQYSSTNTLHNKIAVCNGYANLTAALNRAIGIKTKVVSGDATSNGVTSDHAWNEMYIDGKWIIQDTTWGAGYVNQNNKFVFKLTHDYFNPMTTKFMKDHKKTGEESY